MKIHRTTLYAAVCALVLTGCGASAASITEADRSAIQGVVENFRKAILSGDFEAAASNWSEDATAMPPHASAVHGRADIQKLFAGFGKTTAFTQNVVETDGRGDLAYSRLTFEATFTPPGATAPVTDKGKVLLVLGRQADGNWLVTKAAWNSDLPLPK